MYSTESIRSSSVINVIKWEIDTLLVVVRAKCTQLVYCQLVEPCTNLPENSLDLHGLENWPLSRQKKTEFRSNTENFHPCKQG